MDSLRLCTLSPPPLPLHTLTLSPTHTHTLLSLCPLRLLEAVGFRNDSGDFFKIPGNSTASWRQRVRDTLCNAIEELDERVSEKGA